MINYILVLVRVVCIRSLIVQHLLVRAKRMKVLLFIKM
ncbi:hypothetical protein [Klebsiella phage 05F01]|nr:hypothetical protein [Klebsiella phage 05F01]